jgi:hypothetical protein
MALCGVLQCTRGPRESALTSARMLETVPLGKKTATLGVGYQRNDAVAHTERDDHARQGAEHA